MTGIQDLPAVTKSGTGTWDWDSGTWDAGRETRDARRETRGLGDVRRREVGFGDAINKQHLNL